MYHYLIVAILECFSNYNAAHLLCPVKSIGSCSTRVSICFHIQALAWHFPAVCKFYRIAHYQLTLSGEVVLSITIKISTQATYLSLYSQTKGDSIPYQYSLRLWETHFIAIFILSSCWQIKYSLHILWINKFLAMLIYCTSIPLLSQSFKVL